MPLLTDNRPTKKINLPGYEGSEVEIYGSLLLKDTQEMDIEASGNTAKSGIQAVTKLIKSWNFTDADGNVLPITVENVGLLTTEASEALMKAVQDISIAEKKS